MKPAFSDLSVRAISEGLRAGEFSARELADEALAAKEKHIPGRNRTPLRTTQPASITGQFPSSTSARKKKQ